MAASSSCNSIGAGIDKSGNLVHQRDSSNGGAEGSLRVGLPHIKQSTDDHCGHLIISNQQASRRFASIAVAATAWAGLSIFPAQALATAYEGDHRNVGVSVFNTSTSMLQLSDRVNLPRDFEIINEPHEQDGTRMFNAESMEAAVGNVPSIKPPNEGLNSPWVPKINGPKMKDYNNRSASMRCPKWTESELEMVLPDFQGRPKPFPRKQGHLYPFWPATASTNNEGDHNTKDKNLIQDKFKQSSNGLSSFVIESTASTPDEHAHIDTDDHKRLPTSPAPPLNKLDMPIKKPSCFTM